MFSSQRAYSAYFLGLEVDGIRCFGKPQSLRLSDGTRPARWTILLGENGTGKSTLLQMLACLRPSTSAFAIDHGLEPYLSPAGFPGFNWRPWLRESRIP